MRSNNEDFEVNEMESHYSMMVIASLFSRSEQADEVFPQETLLSLLGQNDAIYHILSYLDPEDLHNVGLINKTLLSVSDWNWQQLIKQYFPTAEALSEFHTSPRKLFFHQCHQINKMIGEEKIPLALLLAALSGKLKSKDLKILPPSSPSRNKLLALALVNNQSDFANQLAGLEGFYEAGEIHPQTLEPNWGSIINMASAKNNFQVVKELLKLRYIKYILGARDLRDQQFKMVYFAMVNAAARGYIDEDTVKELSAKEDHRKLCNSLRFAYFMMAPCYQDMPAHQRSLLFYQSMAEILEQENQTASLQAPFLHIISREQVSYVILSATLNDHFEVVEMLLSSIVSERFYFDDIMRVWEAAIIHDKKEICDLLYRKYYNYINVVDEAGFVAARYGKTPILEQLINFMSPEGKIKAFYLSVNAGAWLSINYFLSQDFPWMDDNCKAEALVKAAKQRRIDSVKHLLNMPKPVLNKHGFALRQAVLNRDLEMATFLLNHPKVHISKARLGEELVRAVNQSDWDMTKLLLSRAKKGLGEKHIFYITCAILREGPLVLIIEFLNRFCLHQEGMSELLHYAVIHNRVDFIKYIFLQSSLAISDELREKTTSYAITHRQEEIVAVLALSQFCHLGSSLVTPVQETSSELEVQLLPMFQNSRSSTSDRVTQEDQLPKQKRRMT